jgi:hypothetical protein
MFEPVLQPYADALAGYLGVTLHLIGTVVSTLFVIIVALVGAVGRRKKSSVRRHEDEEQLQHT